MNRVFARHNLLFLERVKRVFARYTNYSFLKRANRVFAIYTICLGCKTYETNECHNNPKLIHRRQKDVTSAIFGPFLSTPLPILFWAKLFVG